MATEPTIPGTLLWVGGDALSRELIEGAAIEFRLSARFCGRDEVLDIVRTVPVELLGLELDSDPRQCLNLIKELHDRLPRMTLFAVSADGSVPMMRAALERGANDFLSLPLNRQEVHKSLIKYIQLAARQAATGAVGELITVCGSRGGIGVTTVAVNSVSETFSSAWQPGIALFNTAASLRAAHTVSRGASRVISPVISIPTTPSVAR